jgi:hypothetical protein
MTKIAKRKSLPVFKEAFWSNRQLHEISQSTTVLLPVAVFPLIQVNEITPLNASDAKSILTYVIPHVCP